MKPTKDQLLKINEITRYIFSNFKNIKEVNEDNDELIYTDEMIENIVGGEEEIEYIEIWFPAEEDEGAVISIEEYLELEDELKTITTKDNKVIISKSRRYYIVNVSDSYKEYILTDYYDLSVSPQKGIEINLISKPFFVGLIASNLDIYDKDYLGTLSPYLAIEVKYTSPVEILSTNKEISLVKSFIYEIADSIGIALNFSEIRDSNYQFEESREEAEEIDSDRLRDLEPYNEGMELFVSAIQIEEPELKFLNFYKVLEHFSPIAVNIDANELMRKKLDAPKSKFENGDYIRSIFELATSMSNRFNDEDLIKASFQSCIDFVGLFELLPKSIIKKTTKHLKIKNITYSSNYQTILTATNMVSKIIYKTRNKVVHAKSNFTPTGDEIKSDEYHELNTFMKEASSQAIRWYNRQPNHLKMEIIK